MVADKKFSVECVGKSTKEREIEVFYVDGLMIGFWMIKNNYIRENYYHSMRFRKYPNRKKSEKLKGVLLPLPRPPVASATKTNLVRLNDVVEEPVAGGDLHGGVDALLALEVLNDEAVVRFGNLKE